MPRRPDTLHVLEMDQLAPPELAARTSGPPRHGRPVQRPGRTPVGIRVPHHRLERPPEQVVATLATGQLLFPPPPLADIARDHDDTARKRPYLDLGAAAEGLR